MNNWQRLEQVIKWTGLSTNAFALGIGLKRSENLYQIKRGSFGISKELARLITLKYPMVNRSWLLTGEGSMLVVSSSEMSEGAIASIPGAIPFYQIDVLSLAQLVNAKPVSHLLLPMFSGATLAANYMGNSMAPDVPSGSTVIVRASQVSAVLPGETYLVATNDYVVLRKVRAVEGDPDVFMLVAANREEFDDMIVEKQHINSIYILQGVILNYQG